MTVKLYAGPKDGDIIPNVTENIHTITFDVQVGPGHSPDGTPRLERHIYKRINNPKNTGPEVIFRHRGFDLAQLT